MNRHGLVAVAVFLIIAVWIFTNYFYQSRLTVPTLRPDNLIITNVFVDHLEALVLESTPIQVNLAVSGHLADPCSEIDEVRQSRVDDQFNLKINASKPADAVCTNSEKTFDRILTLDVAGLTAGIYQVNVNGITTQFTLDVDIPVPTPIPYLP